METQRKLFYTENYEEILTSLSAISDQSISEQHNSAIIKYLEKGENPLSVLFGLINKIRSECGGESLWPIHPSWALINYHIALYYFQHNQIERSIAIVCNAWKHSELIDTITLTFFALLTFELSIRTGDWKISEGALTFFTNQMKDKDNMINTLRQFFEGSKHYREIIDMVGKTQFKVNTARRISKGDEKSRNELKAALDQAVSKTSTFTMGQVFPFLSTALYLNNEAAFNKILNSAQNQSDRSITNNRGVLNILQQKYSSALLHFSKSLATRKTSEVIQPYSQVLYNIGISLLFKGKPRKASEVLHTIIPSLATFPYLWLRLAECCVMYYKQRVAKLRAQKQLSKVIMRRISTPTKTFTILPPSNAKLFARYSIGKDSAGPDLSLEFAQKCADNAFHLASETQNQIKMNAELISAYVCLELNEPQNAIEHAKTIISSSHADSSAKFTARVYSAQAVSMMHDGEKANEFLKPIVLEYKLGSPKDAKMYALTSEQIVLLYPKIEHMNLKIKENVLNCPEFIIARAACELRKGKTIEALRILNNFTQESEE